MGHLNAEQLKAKLIEAEQLVDKKSPYFHYKHPDKFYRIEGFCLIEETEEAGVLYRPFYKDYEDIVWMRPLSVFASEVEVDGKRIRRFDKLKVKYRKSVGVIINDEGKLLVTREFDQEHFFALGGTVKEGEEDEECLIREIKEEINCDVIGKPIHLFDMPPVEAVTDKTNFVQFICYQVQIEGTPKPGDDIEECAWVGIEEYRNKRYNVYSKALVALIEKLIEENYLK